LIRKTLLEQGIVLEDKPSGLTEWRRAWWWWKKKQKKRSKKKK
jgi:hypothetical protein